MDPLATRARLLELEAELQRGALAVRLDAARRRPGVAWLLPPIGAVVLSMWRPQARWLSALWMVVRLVTRGR
jgi:hypothetical protein